MSSYAQVNELNYNFQQINFSALPRTAINPMSIKLWDSYNNGGPTTYGTVLEIYGRSGHQTSQINFGGWDNSKIRYREAFYAQNSWSEWVTLLDSKNDIESSGKLKISGAGAHYILNGNVGIGTTNPTGKLEISGGNLIVNRPLNKVDNNGISEFSAFEINNSFASGQTGYVKVFYPSYNNLLFGADYDGHIGGVQPNIQFGQKDTPVLTVVNNGNYTGNVGIGTQNPAYKLDVLGTIRAKEVLVNLDGGADFVFEKGYKLLPIEHVANYVQENKHLPDIPSANEMVKNGVSMGDMQVKLLQKVEELTLYAIQQNKEIEILKKRINELETK